MEQLFRKNVFSRTCTLRGKNDVQLTFDESYVYYVSKIDVFKEVLCYFSLMEQLFLNKLFSGTCTLRGKKMMYN